MFCLILITTVSLLLPLVITTISPPHCSRVSLMSGMVTVEQPNSARFTLQTSFSSQLSAGQTLCLKMKLNADDIAYGPTVDKDLVRANVDNRTLLYAFRYVEFEQQYPVEIRYDFGIPTVHNSCYCDCPGGKIHCPRHYSHSQCDRGVYCRRIVLAHKSTTGCYQSDPNLEQGAFVCCEISIKPQSDRIFQALSLGQPEHFAKLRYTAYLSHNDSDDLQLLDDQIVTIPMGDSLSNTVADDIFASAHLLSKSDQHQLVPYGVNYVVRGDKKNELLEVRPGTLNDLQTVSLQKLGWLRYIEGTWVMAATDDHYNWVDVQVDNCQLQQYRMFSGFRYCNERSEAIFDRIQNRVIRDTLYDAELRTVRTFQGVGQPISLTLDFNQRREIFLSYHLGYLGDFEGNLRLDERSRRYFNVTFVQSKGKIFCRLSPIHSHIDKQPELTIATHIDPLDSRSFTQLIPVGADITTDKQICCYPAFNPKNFVCKLVAYSTTPLQRHQISQNSWISGLQGTCDGCNEPPTIPPTVENSNSFWNPSSWFSSADSVIDVVKKVFTGLSAVAVLLILIAILRRCILPLLKWSVCAKLQMPSRSINSTAKLVNKAEPVPL